MNRNLNPRQFKGYTLTHDQDADFSTVNAYHPDFGGGQVPVGVLDWFKAAGTLPSGREVRAGEINNVNVMPEHRHQGLATEMYRMANEYPTQPLHGSVKTLAGIGWSAKTGGKHVSN